MLLVIDATDSKFKNIFGFPTEQQLSKTVLELPAATQGKILCPDELPRNLEPGKLSRFMLEEGKLRFMGVKDTFSVLDTNAESVDDIHILTDPAIFGFSIGQQKIGLPLNLVGIAGKAVIKDKNDKPIILCKKERLHLNKSWYIYGKTPLFDGDAKIETEDGVDFYPWFKVRDIDDSHLEWRTVLIWNGNYYAVYLRVNNAKKGAVFHQGEGGDGFLEGKDRVPHKNDLYLCDPQNPETVYGLFSKNNLTDKVKGWEVEVAPGADVGLCMALAVLLDDMVGWFA